MRSISTHRRPSLAPVASVIALVIASLLATACGEAEVATDVKESPTTSAATGSLVLSDEFCALLAADNVPEDLASEAPDGYGDATQKVVELTSLLDALDNEEVPTPDELSRHTEALSQPGIADALGELAQSASTTCDDAPGIAAFDAVAGAARIVSSPTDPALCRVLEASVSETTTGAEPDIAALLSAAPPAMRDEIAPIEALDREGRPSAEESAALFGIFLGLGLYSEVHCQLPGSFGPLVFAGAIVGSGFGDAGGSDQLGDSESETAAMATPPTADASAAVAAIPAGSPLSWTVEEVATEDDGRYLVSAVVPVGWEHSLSFGVTYEPPTDAGFSIFDELTFKAGCDGVCEATEWESRLRGADGYLSSFGTDGATSELPVPGSPGVILTSRQASGDVAAVVLRWDDSQPRYFQCNIDLDADHAALLEAFTAACVASRPGWISVAA